MAKKKTAIEKLAEPVGYLPQQRYAIGGDNSGHEYFIKVEELDEFYKWAEDEDTEDPGKYDEYRIDGHFTFTDPRNE